MSFFNFRLDGNSRRFESEIIVRQGNGHGSTNTKIRRFSSIVSQLGSDITYGDSATLGASFTINTSGIYFISYTDYNTGASDQLGLSLNSTELTTNIFSIDPSNLLAAIYADPGLPSNNTVSFYFQEGDIVRPHANGSLNSSVANNNNIFIVRRIG